MSILVIAEHDNSNLKPSTLNTVAAANLIGGSVHLLVVGSTCQAVADACAAIAVSYTHLTLPTKA